MDFSGKTALITGASRGIGKAIALKFASLGANVAVVYAGNETKAQETKEEIVALGVKCNTYKVDVSKFDECGTLVKSVIEDFGGIDVLVNNAGITKDSLVLSMKEEDFDSVIDVNLKGAFNMIKHTYSPFMRKRKGRIINVTSVVGITGNAGQANYASSKSGLIGLTKSVARELAARNVTCNCVAPGYIETDMTDVLSDKVKDAVISTIPMKKIGKGEDIANAVVFLASEEASYITGEVLKIDGGMAM